MAGWRTVVVNIHSKLSYKNNHLIFRNSYKTEMIHLSEIDILLLETTDIVLTTMLVKRLVAVSYTHLTLPTKLEV